MTRPINLAWDHFLPTFELLIKALVDADAAIATGDKGCLDRLSAAKEICEELHAGLNVPAILTADIETLIRYESMSGMLSTATEILDEMMNALVSNLPPSTTQE